MILGRRRRWERETTRQRNERNQEMTGWPGTGSCSPLSSMKLAYRVSSTTESFSYGGRSSPETIPVLKTRTENQYFEWRRLWLGRPTYCCGWREKLDHSRMSHGADSHEPEISKYCLMFKRSMRIGLPMRKGHEFGIRGQRYNVQCEENRIVNKINQKFRIIDGGREAWTEKPGYRILPNLSPPPNYRPPLFVSQT